MTFRLYPVEQRWCSFADYGAMLDVVRDLQSKTVLEFGPGSSTLALIEGGATSIDTCEDNWQWAETYRDRLQDRFPHVVTIRLYLWSEMPLYVPGIGDKRYDLAVIDGPHDKERRPVVVEYCLQRCDNVLVALECNEGSQLMRNACIRLALDQRRPLTIMDTGPLAGAFGLIGPPPC